MRGSLRPAEPDPASPARRDREMAVTALPDPLRVLHVTTSTYPGGAERMLLRTLREFRRRGAAGLAPRVEARVLCVQPLELVGRQALEDGFTVEALGVPSPRGIGGMIAWPFREIGVVRATRRLIASFRPHVVHGWLPRGSMVARLAAAGTDAAVVTDLQIAHDPRTWQATLDGWTRALGDHWIACSAAVAEYHARAARIPRERLSVAANALEERELEVPASAATFRERQGIAADAVLLAFAGRLHEQKGIGTLLEAIASVRGEHPRLRAMIAGDGPDRASLVARARALGLDGVASFPGHLAEPRDLLASADVFCLPSLYEGLPLVLLEAMAMGTASVATNIPGTDEVIRDGVDGLLVPPGDAAALARALTRLVADATLRRDLGAAGRARVRDAFLMDRNADRVLAAYSAARAHRAGSA